MAGYWDGFFAISDGRGLNQVGVDPLPVSEILAYCDLAGIPRGDPGTKFLRLMRAMDGVFLKHHYKKNKNKSEGADGQRDR